MRSGRLERNGLAVGRGDRRAGRGLRRLAAVVAGLGLGLGGLSAVLGAAGTSVAGALTAAHEAIKPLIGHRVAGYHPRSGFAASPKHLRGPRKAVAGIARPPRPMRPVRRTALERAETTPTVEVEARPNGLLSMTSNVFPVRARVHGEWRALNPVPRRAAGGAWAPAIADTRWSPAPPRTPPVSARLGGLVAHRKAIVYWQPTPHKT